MIHKKYYELLKKQEELLNKKNKKADFYNGIYDRYENPVLTREHIPLTWQYDLNEETKTWNQCSYEFRRNYDRWKVLFGCQN